jgi:hypothetical protein
MTVTDGRTQWRPKLVQPHGRRARYGDRIVARSPKYWVSGGTWIWFPECQRIVAKHFHSKPLDWIANEVLQRARAINQQRGHGHLGPASVTGGSVLFCARRLELLTQEEYDTLATTFVSKKRRTVRSGRLKAVDGTTYFSPVLRTAVLTRDAGVCQYCSATADGIDHVVPVSAGGKTDAANLVACCTTCNSVKGDRLLPKSIRAFVLGAIRVGRTVDMGWPPLWQQAFAKCPWSNSPQNLRGLFETMTDRAGQRQ